MHFSVLTLLACTLLTVSAAPVQENGITVDIPIKVADVLVGDTIEVLNNVLKGGKRHGDDGISLTVPIKASNIGNGNDIDILDGLLSGGKRDGISVTVPITISDILNCNDLEIANHLLSSLAFALKGTVSQLGITAQDILDCDASSIGELIRKITRSLGKISKRHGDDGVNVDIPITLENILNGNVIKVLNNVLNGKRDGISIKAPIDVSHVADYNVVDILDDLLKRDDGVSVNASVDVWNIANGNKVGILNNI
ncbi:hypothetical protein FIBSPDRAFT_1045963 [Athelia psychrophila]|uniref:Uncharacterized protein n=1 Tax=Athelia psychrophila TaxID=1759441 RepID=A0A166HH83_9AGAM|nr:hypothetical protein FIBSPDRAFT_1045963 [Fibularhizoctonia sp. CBS 109695]